MKWVREKIVINAARNLDKLNEKNLNENKNENLDIGANTQPDLKRHFQSLDLIRAEVIYKGSCVYATTIPSTGSGSGAKDSDSNNIMFHGIIPNVENWLTFVISPPIPIGLAGASDARSMTGAWNRRGPRASGGSNAIPA